MAEKKTGRWTEHSPKDPCPFCGEEVFFRLIEVENLMGTYWRVVIREDNDCPLSDFIESTESGPLDRVCAELEREWHESVETVTHMPACPQCGRSPVCKSPRKTGSWSIACPEGHVRAGSVLLSPALRAWKQNVEQRNEEHGCDRLADMLNELWRKSGNGATKEANH